MPQPTHTGPKRDKEWNGNMPVEHLREVLPDDSNLARALAPAGPPIQTGLILGHHVLTGVEPYLFDASAFLLMGDLTAAGDTDLTNVIAMNGDLYVFGTSYTGSGLLTDGLTVRWDPETRTWTDLAAGAGFDYDSVLRAVRLGDDIYFTHVNSDLGTFGIAVLDGASDGISSLALPVSGRPYAPQVNGGTLIVPGDYASGVDIVTYDPAAAAGSQFAQYSLPGDDYIFSNLVGSAGDFTYLLGFSPGDSTFNYYSLNVQTGAVSLAYDDLHFYNTEIEGQTLGFFGSVGGDLYMVNWTGSGATELLKADDSTGAVTVVLTASDDGVMYNHLFLLLEETDDALWFANQGSDDDKIVKVSADGTLTIFDTQADYVYGIQELGGAVYVSASVAGVHGIYSLGQDGALTFLSSVGNAIHDNLVGTVGDHLVVLTDSDGNGTFELWTSNAPADAASWTRITPDDVSVTGQYINVIDGDYIL